MDTAISFKNPDHCVRKAIMDYHKKHLLETSNSVCFHKGVSLNNNTGGDYLLQARIRWSKELADCFGDHSPSILSGADYTFCTPQHNNLRVGEGSFGLVVLGQEINTKKLVIGKLIKKKDEDEDGEQAIYSMLKEYMYQWRAFNILQKAQTTNPEKDIAGVPQPIGFLKIKNTRKHRFCEYMLVSEYCSLLPDASSAMSMAEALNANRDNRAILSLREWRDVSVGLLRASHELQKHDVYHNDLKPPNVMIEFKHGKVRPHIIDFGLASTSINYSESHRPMFDIKYEKRCPQTAPELFRRPTPLDSSDLYSYGHILFQMGEKMNMKGLRDLSQYYHASRVNGHFYTYEWMMHNVKCCWNQLIRHYESIRARSAEIRNTEDILDLERKRDSMSS